MSQDEHSDEFESVYNDEGREELVEDDEISPQEEAFMAGYDSDPEEKKKKKDEDDDEAYDEAFEKKKKK
ncbi:hypothetical protein CMO90_04200 [Candidatus Woesearchaeota archaeon]|jgi:hypothetical protein|nr:hypothetical protein [Candidatus Woesearchaeota archaeon]|tara:strand:+ start:316 stop:522 length:207 start_codon:yes stop_codon:yes gene_type:complete